MTATLEIAFAAGADAANRKMRADGRTVWSASDADLAAEVALRMMQVAA